MRRNYTVNEYKEKVFKILEKRKETAIGTDVITGFPTETEKDFEESYKNLKEIPFAYMHIFTYSERKGVYAEKFGDRVKPQEKKRRTKLLIDLSNEKSFNFKKRFLDKTLEVLVISKKDGFRIGITGNYIHIKFKSDKDINTITKVKLTEIGKEREDNKGIEVV